MNRIRTLLLIALMAVTAGAWLATRSPGSVPGVSPAQAQDATTSDQVALAPDYALGAKDAPITLIEYASFTCPHCARFDETVMPKLKANYIDTGKVRYIQREVYFDRYGLWAGLVARCDGEAKYYAISNMLYEDQKGWLDDGKPETVVENLRKIGRKAGMTDEQINACLQDNDRARAMVAAYQTHAAEDDIKGTPTLIINGEKYSNMSYEDLAKILDEKLAGK